MGKKRSTLVLVIAGLAICALPLFAGGLCDRLPTRPSAGTAMMKNLFA